MSTAFPSTAKLLTDLVEMAAGSRPDAEALTDGADRYSWAEYRDRSAVLAGALVARGVEPGDRVGVLMPKSIRSFVAVHAIQRAGAIVVPLDWFAPDANVHGVLGEAGVGTLVTTASGRRLDGLAPLGLALVDPSADLDDAPIDPHPADPDDPAYIIFTSGSTGRPKGIVHTHASALAYARRAVDTYELGVDDRLANIAPLHFDQSTFELYAAPLAGAAVVVVPDGVVRFPASLAALLDAERATVLYTVPYVIEQLVERGDLPAGGLASLRWVKYGGEAFAPSRLRAAMAALPDARFSNVYGPAEVNQCTVHHVDTPPADDGSVPIGLPWDGVEMLIVDGEHVVDDDRPGELWVAGPTTMRGYWERPDLTDRSLTTRNDGTGPWYRTGDLVRRSDDGLIFLGRADNQVKVRGNRVELEAIDAVLRDHASVSGGAAFVDRTGAEPRLVAVVSPELDDSEKKSLIAHLRSQLPPYAVPTDLFVVGSLPRTPTGKIDRPATASAIADLSGADTPTR